MSPDCSNVAEKGCGLGKAESASSRHEHPFPEGKSGSVQGSLKASLRKRRVMLIRRILAWQWELRSPPIAASTLMVLLCLFWLTGVEESFALVPGLLSNPLQAFRLVTYCLCHTDAHLLFVNLLFFPPLGWRPELRQGTLRYLHTSLLGAAISALLYLLLAGLWGAQPDTVVGSYTPVHLVLLGSQQRHHRWRGLSGWISVALLAGLLLGLSQILSPHSPFLLHICGLLTGLAYWAGIFSLLEPSEGYLERLHSRLAAWTSTRSSPFLRFVKPPTAGTLPLTDPAAKTERIPQLQAPGRFSGEFHPQLLPPALPSTSPWSREITGLGQKARIVLPSSSLPPFSASGGALGVPVSTLQEALTDEELLQAGIQASLQDMAAEEVTLSKSSVSSLRLQQLQKMGFPTEEAVVALAATGHVEGAVSLLIGGHVGNQAVVKAQSPLPLHQQPPSGEKVRK